VSANIHTYAGKGAIVTWDASRCIHAAECVRRVPQSFDPLAKPWIVPDNASVDALADAVNACPSGALAMRCADGTSAMATFPANTCDVTPNGPYYLRGTLALKQGEEVAGETRMALCRCGGSRNKPFCDNTHKTNGFASATTLHAAKAPPADADLAQPLRVVPTKDGPLHCTGPVTLRDAAGVSAFMDAGYLCRCGGSQNKPFCDGTHRKIGFAG